MQYVLYQWHFSRKQPYLSPSKASISGISRRSQRRKFGPLLFKDWRPRKWRRGVLERVFVKLLLNFLVLKKSSVSPLYETRKPLCIIMFHILMWFQEWFHKCYFVGALQISCRKKKCYSSACCSHFTDKETGSLGPCSAVRKW